jgi:DNA gyrase/topoisomerase IV subunit A
MPIRLVAGWGNFGDRSFPDPAEPEYTRCRPSHVGQLVLDAEAHRLAPVPVGLINGTAYGGGTQPPLEPFQVLAALQRLLEGRRVADAEVLRIVGPPYPVTGCDLTGNLDALIKGRRGAIRQTGRITITGVPVPEPVADTAVPPDRRGWTGYEVSSRPSRPAHLIIESLPARTSPLDAYRAITKQAGSHGWYGSGPERVERPALPVAEVNEQSSRNQVRIGLVLKPGSDPAAVRERLVAVDGITTEATWAFAAPLARMLRAWVDRYRDEDIAASLDLLHQAIRRDRRREQRNN